MAQDSELWDVIFDGHHNPMEIIKEGEISLYILNSMKDYNEGDFKKIKKNYKAENPYIQDRTL